MTRAGPGPVPGSTPRHTPRPAPCAQSRAQRWALAGFTAPLVCGALALAALQLLPGCSAKGEWTDADDLRLKLEETQTQLRATEAERDEARAKLAEIERARVLGAPQDVSRDVIEALPRCAAIELDRFTGPAAPTSDSPPRFKAAEVYLRTLDGRRRFTQVSATLRVRVDYLPEPGAGGPVQVASAELSPLELRDAYRSSPLGTHYFARLPLDREVGPGGSLAFSVQVLDGVTGSVLEATLTQPVPR